MGTPPSDVRTRYRLLVVDDDPVTHRLVRTWFQGQPYDVLGAADGREGLQKARSEHPDLVLMDVKMPGIGGIAAADQLRRSHPDVVVMLLSVTPEHALPADLMTCGARFCHKERFGPEVLDSLWRDRMP